MTKWGITYRQVSDLCDIVDEIYYGKTVENRIKAESKLKRECAKLGVTVDQAYRMYEE